MSMTPQLPLDSDNPRSYLRHAPLVDRLMYRTSVTPDGCWIWRGSLDKAGYGNIGGGGDAGPVLKTHRAAYECLVGPIPIGLTLDHLCRTRSCLNPEHLEPVTLTENIRRGNEHRRATGLCPNGHEMTPETTIPTGKNRCRECARQRNRAYKARRRGVAA